MCVVVVVEMDSDVIVCALTSTPVSPPALPSTFKKKLKKNYCILAFKNCFHRNKSNFLTKHIL